MRAAIGLPIRGASSFTWRRLLLKKTSLIPATSSSRMTDNFEIYEDDQIIELVQKGDQHAFAVLFKRYNMRLLHASYAIVHNLQDAREITQEAFVKIYTNIAKFQLGTNFYTWAYRIVRNLSIDRYRRKKTAKEVEFDSDYQRNFSRPEEVLPPSLGINPEKVCTTAELRQQISKALDSLSEKHRTILILREVDGLQYDEIAEVLGIQTGTVMSRLFNARKNMQAFLRDYLECNDLKK
ncbi:MAG: sigma-70 family RNA polymerase sigma factor [Proteobacteria bacterium]|nr:sigma-70 family RNA polymerase sigma factor [Pseudomonadota bacterium]